MTIRTRKIAVLLTAAGLAGATGIGAANAASESNSNSTSTTAKQRGPGGPGHRGPRPLKNAQIEKIATALGVTSAELKSALEANRPSKPSGANRGPARLASELASKLGVETSAVKEILDANKPARPTSKPANGTAPPKPDFSKLIAALADGLNIDQATVQAAFDELDTARKADETARRTAFYAAIATSLGTTSDAVQSAFEAVLPAKPAS